VWQEGQDGVVIIIVTHMFRNRSEGAEPCSSRRKMHWVDLEINQGWEGPDELEGSDLQGGRCVSLVGSSPQRGRREDSGHVF